MNGTGTRKYYYLPEALVRSTEFAETLLGFLDTPLGGSMSYMFALPLSPTSYLPSQKTCTFSGRTVARMADAAVSLPTAVTNREAASLTRWRLLVEHLFNMR